MTNDLATGKFTKATDISFDAGKCRHGSFLPLKKSEFNALADKYDIVFGEIESEPQEIFSMSFEDNMEATGASVTPSGTFSYVEGVTAGTKAAKFTAGNVKNHIKVDGSIFKGLGEITISFAAKFNHPTGGSSGRSWLFYAAKTDDALTWEKDGNREKYVGLIWGENSGKNLQAQRFWNGRTPSPSAAVENNKWQHITIVFGRGYTTIFVNGTQVAREETSVNLYTILGGNPTVYIGRANWGGGEYSDCILDEYRIFNYGMTADQVKEHYTAIMGVTE